MNRKELAKVLNVSPTAVGNWEIEGMPIKQKGGRGRQNDYDLDECVTWLKRNGKGLSIRTDRKDFTTRINTMTQPAGSKSTPRPDYLRVTEQEIEAAMIAAGEKSAQNAFVFVQENFLIAAAALMKFGGFSAGDAMNLGFRIAGTYRLVGCQIFNFEKTDLDPQSWAGRYLSGDTAALAELEQMAIELQEIWETRLPAQI